jgi:hypothetical protein
MSYRCFHTLHSMMNICYSPSRQNKTSGDTYIRNISIVWTFQRTFVFCFMPNWSDKEHIFPVSRDTCSMLAVHRYKPHQDSAPTPTTTHQLTHTVALLMISEKCSYHQDSKLATWLLSQSRTCRERERHIWCFPHAYRWYEPLKTSHTFTEAEGHNYHHGEDCTVFFIRRVTKID